MADRRLRLVGDAHHARQLRSVAPSEAAPVWMRAGACVRRQDLDWFPTDELSTARAKAVCRACPVKQRCLAFAIEHREYGVWGETTESDRRAMRREEPSGGGCDLPSAGRLDEGS